jgi:hypothetical protein
MIAPGTCELNGLFCPCATSCLNCSFASVIRICGDQGRLIDPPGWMAAQKKGLADRPEPLWKKQAKISG